MLSVLVLCIILKDVWHHQIRHAIPCSGVFFLYACFVFYVIEVILDLPYTKLNEAKFSLTLYPYFLCLLEVFQSVRLSLEFLFRGYLGRKVHMICCQACDFSTKYGSRTCLTSSIFLASQRWCSYQNARERTDSSGA